VQGYCTRHRRRLRILLRVVMNTGAPSLLQAWGREIARVHSSLQRVWISIENKNQNKFVIDTAFIELKFKQTSRVNICQLPSDFAFRNWQALSMSSHYKSRFSAWGCHPKYPCNQWRDSWRTGEGCCCQWDCSHCWWRPMVHYCIITPCVCCGAISI